MLNINIKEEYGGIKISELKTGDFFLLSDSIEEREVLCQVIRDDVVEVNKEFPITFLDVEKGWVNRAVASAIVRKVDVEINVTLSK